MLKLVANGTITIPLPFYRDVAAMLVDLGVTPTDLVLDAVSGAGAWRWRCSRAC